MLIIWNDFDEIKGLPEVNVEHRIKRLQGQVLNLMCKITQYLGYRTLPVPYIKFEMHNCISLGCLLVVIFKSIGIGQTLNHLVIIDISTLAFQQYPVQHTSLASSVANWIFFIKVITCMCQDYWPRFRNLLKSLILLINWGDSVCNNFATCGFGLDLSFLRSNSQQVPKQGWAGIPVCLMNS